MSIPVTMLIDEHKLIMRAVDVIKRKIAEIKANKAVNPKDISAFLDFFRTYADKFHHGKEEGILFNQLSKRELNNPDKNIMDELIIEHALARRTVTALENAKEDYVSGKTESLDTIEKLLESLANLYPTHIEKENEHFFFPSMAYFNRQEQEDMSREFQDFNRNFTEKRYSQIISSLEITQ